MLRKYYKISLFLLVLSTYASEKYIPQTMEVVLQSANNKKSTKIAVEKNLLNKFVYFQDILNTFENLINIPYILPYGTKASHFKQLIDLIEQPLTSPIDNAQNNIAFLFDLSDGLLLQESLLWIKIIGAYFKYELAAKEEEINTHLEKDNREDRAVSLLNMHFNNNEIVSEWLEKPDNKYQKAIEDRLYNKMYTEPLFESVILEKLHLMSWDAHDTTLPSLAKWKEESLYYKLYTICFKDKKSIKDIIKITEKRDYVDLERLDSMYDLNLCDRYLNEVGENDSVYLDSLCLKFVQSHNYRHTHLPLLKCIRRKIVPLYFLDLPNVKKLFAADVNILEKLSSSNQEQLLIFEKVPLSSIEGRVANLKKVTFSLHEDHILKDYIANKGYLVYCNNREKCRYAAWVNNTSAYVINYSQYKNFYQNLSLIHK